MTPKEIIEGRIDVITRGVQQRALEVRELEELLEVRMTELTSGRGQILELRRILEQIAANEGATDAP